MDWRCIHAVTVCVKIGLMQWDVISDIANGYGYLQYRNFNRTYEANWYNNTIPQKCILSNDEKTLFCEDQDLVWGISSIILVQAPMLLGGGFFLSLLLLTHFSSVFVTKFGKCGFLGLCTLGSLPLQFIPYPLVVLSIQLMYLLTPKQRHRGGWELEELLVIFMSIEAAAEAGPQTLLQLYILGSDFEKEWETLTKVTLVSSVFTIAKSVITLFTRAFGRYEKGLSDGECSGVVRLYTSVFEFLPVFSTSIAFRATSSAICLVMFRSLGFVPLVAGSFIITILSFVGNKNKSDLFGRSIQSLHHGFANLVVLTSYHMGTRHEDKIPMMISCIVWLVIHSISLLVIMVMVSTPEYHLDHWSNTAKLPYLDPDYVHNFFTIIAVLLLLGFINMFLVWYQIYSVDWQNVDMNIEIRMRGDIQFLPGEGLLKPLLRKIEKCVLQVWIMLKMEILFFWTTFLKKFSYYSWDIDMAESKKGFEFVKCSGDFIPSNAFHAGKDETGEIVYVARAKHLSSEIPAKLLSSSDSVLVSWGVKVVKSKKTSENQELSGDVWDAHRRVEGEIHVKDDFEVLVQETDEDTLHWVDALKGSPESLGAITGGHQANGNPVYVGRAKLGKNWLIGRVNPWYNACFVVSTDKKGEMREFERRTYQVLCVKKSSDPVPGQTEERRTENGTNGRETIERGDGQKMETNGRVYNKFNMYTSISFDRFQ